MLRGILAFGLTRRAVILLGLLVFIGAGLVAFTKLNIEAYPNPAPVILEITAQAAGLSAEEMERYYTIPMEIGLYPTPGDHNSVLENPSPLTCSGVAAGVAAIGDGARPCLDLVSVGDR